METENDPKTGVPELKAAKKEKFRSGKRLRKQCPRKSHATLCTDNRPDTLDIHQQQTKNRIGLLLPIYYERMLESPFGYYRGAAAIMAADLSRCQSTGLHLQICGDCHLMNFGGFATPERKIIFDINDFDETTTAPWEWDVKRLAASFVIAGCSKGFSRKSSKYAALAAVKSYKKHMRKYAGMSALQVWYADINFSALVNAESGGAIMKKFNRKRLEKAIENTPHEREFEKLTHEIDGKIKIIDAPPLLFHVKDEHQATFFAQVEQAYENYLNTLSHDRQILLNQYKIIDIAMKVVGVGSVGKWCGIILLMSDSGDPLFLQFKEAHQSVLEPYTTACEFENQGQRVVEGQKIMQSASDIFLGWTTGDTGRHYYIRQMRDAKITPDLDAMDYNNFTAYAESCGWALAQAHARTGEAATISGYIGKSDTFANAIAKFALAYRQQNESDYNLLFKAVEDGTISAKPSSGNSFPS